MAGTVSSYQQGAFSTPVNGTTADATVVLSNDNATRGKFNSHDADATIHVQSSVLASRPGASVAQRVWVTTDGLRAYIDSGSTWNELAYLSLAAGGTVSGPVVLSSTLAVSGASTLAAVTATTAQFSDAFRQYGANAARFENTFIGLPTGATGVGVEIGVSAGKGLIQSVNRSSFAQVATVFGDAVTVSNGLTVSAAGASITGNTTISSGILALSATTSGASAGDVVIPNAAFLRAVSGATTVPIIGLDVNGVVQLGGGNPPAMPRLTSTSQGGTNVGLKGLFLAATDLAGTFVFYDGATGARYKFVGTAF